MALVYTPESQTLEKMPAFRLLNVDDVEYKSADLVGEKGTLVIFICNHCPYVKKMMGSFAEELEKVQALGVSVIAINANDASVYPDDSFDNMKLFAKENGFNFPYLYDETQQVAKSFGAVCTPDFFGFDAEGSLVFRGCFEEVLPFYDALLAEKELPEKQTPSMGCSIKWRESA